MSEAAHDISSVANSSADFIYPDPKIPLLRIELWRKTHHGTQKRFDFQERPWTLYVTLDS